ncbi:unnamed protein product [Brassica rapa]|uniref:Uncharacterized protein n=1 Tax=Brassica campestris TaxID=3711 RepID=A0A8D9LZZ9_BRACM|nr:unnamed protein product [Brassica rapa]
MTRATTTHHLSNHALPPRAATDTTRHHRKANRSGRNPTIDEPTRLLRRPPGGAERRKVFDSRKQRPKRNCHRHTTDSTGRRNEAHGHQSSSTLHATSLSQKISRTQGKWTGRKP